MFKTAHVRRGAGVAVGMAATFWVGCGDDALSPSAPPVTGSVRVTTFTTGQYLDPDGYRLRVDGDEVSAVAVNGTLALSTPLGEHELELTGVAENCAVEGDNPRSVTVRAGGEVRTAFAVTCKLLMAVTVVSGDGQKGKVGELAGEPLVVRVTDHQGEAISGVSVHWSAGRLASFEGGFDEGGEPVSSVTTRTDADGRTEMSVMPVAFTRMTVTAITACASECGDSQASFTVDARDPGAAIAIVSGNDQQAKAGQLGEPFVVRVTDGEGRGVRHVRVDWSVWFGEGALLGTIDEYGHPVDVDHTRTDADGLTTMSLMPTWFGPVVVDASVVAGGVQDTPATFRADATDPGATLTIVSGDGQEGKTGEILAEPLVVRVNDGHGNPVGNVRVTWAVEEGAGSWGRSTFTEADGVASVDFAPPSLGTIRLSARLPGLTARTVFTTDVSVQLIHLAYDAWFHRPVFYGPNCGWYDWNFSCLPERVPLGATVEWVNHVASARIVSTSAPPGGASFDSGTLSEEARFQFEPSTTGTWEYADSISGVTAAVIVY
jgi:hypothetical protein